MILEKYAAVLLSLNPALWHHKLMSLNVGDAKFRRNGPSARSLIFDKHNNIKMNSRKPLELDTRESEAIVWLAIA